MGGEAISSIFNHKGNSQSHVAAELDAHVGKLFALQEAALGERSLVGSIHSQSTDQRKNMESDNKFLLFTPQSSSRQLLAPLLSSWPRMVPEAGHSKTAEKLRGQMLPPFVCPWGQDRPFRAGESEMQDREGSRSKETLELEPEKELSKQTPRFGVWQKGIVVGGGV